MPTLALAATVALPVATATLAKAPAEAPAPLRKLLLPSLLLVTRWARRARIFPPAVLLDGRAAAAFADAGAGTAPATGWGPASKIRTRTDAKNTSRTCRVHVEGEAKSEKY